MANFWGGWTPPRHSGTWVGARVASLRCHYPPPRRSQYSRNAKARPHKSKTSCRGRHRRGTTISCPGRGPLAGFEVTLYGRFWGDRRGREQFPLAMLAEQFVRGESPLLSWINASDLKGKGDRRISFVAKFVTSRLQAKWWRRGELNPRPR